MMDKIPNKSEGWKNVLNLILPYFFIVGGFQLFAYWITGVKLLNYLPVSETTMQMFFVLLFNMLGTILVIFIFIKYVDKSSFESVGWRRVFVVADIFWGFFFGFIIMLTGFTILILLNEIKFLNWNFNFFDLLLSVGFFLFVAVAEELFMRGYVLNNFLKSFDNTSALILSSALFSLFHGANDFFNVLAMINLFVAGIFFGLAYIHTNNLWFPIALHFSWNFFQGTIFGFNVSGKDTYSLIITKYSTPNSLNGGAFGFEGSFLSILFQVAAIFIMLEILKKRNKKIDSKKEHILIT